MDSNNKDGRVCLDLNVLHETKLTANDYVLLYCKYNNIILPESIYNTCTKNSYCYLEANGYIKITSENNFDLRQKGIDLFKTSFVERKWLEFYSTFPIRVSSRNGGTRPLRAANIDSKANDIPKKKYLKIIKNNPDIHDKIMKVLLAELDMRRNSNEMQYMHNITTWLNQADYDKFSYLLDEKNLNTSTKSSYGQEIK